MYDIPVYEVEPNACDICLGVTTEVLMTRNPRHVHLCPPHLEAAKAMLVSDVLKAGRL